MTFPQNQLRACWNDDDFTVGWAFFLAIQVFDMAKISFKNI